MSLSQKEIDYYNNEGSKLDVTTHQATVNPEGEIVNTPPPAPAAAPVKVNVPATPPVQKEVPPAAPVSTTTTTAQPNPVVNPPVQKEGTAPVAPPEAYEIEVAEDSPLSDSDIDEIVSIAEDRGLTKEQTNKLIASKEAMYKRGSDYTMSQAKLTLERMEAEVRKDPLFATKEAEDKSFEVIDLAINKFGNDALSKKSRDYLKRDIDVLKFLYNIGSQLQEDTHRGTSTANPIQTTENPLEKMYPEFYKK